MPVSRRISAAIAVIVLAALIPVLAASSAVANNPTPHSGTQVIATKHSFDELDRRLRAAISASHMGLVAAASASRGAAAQGHKIRGNLVLMVFRNDFARRMLKAYIPAGIEAPIRLYLTEGADGTATLTYRAPSSLFAPYDNREIDALARELDAIFAKIVAQATGA